MKTSELTGAALDWAVAKSEGYTGTALESRTGEWYTPSTYWGQGGPIIEREKICPCPSDHPVGERWNATDFSGHVTAFGPTPLIAAMRCYVASKLGEEIDVPEDLL